MSRRNQLGLTYVALLILVAIMSVLSMTAASMWVTINQRSKERELLFVGDQIRTAIASYYERTPGTVKRYPLTLADLLKDDRHLQLVRHLRRVPLDPLSGTYAWQEIKGPGGGIVGVYSSAPGQPLKQAGFEGGFSAFEGAESYAEWKFVYIPPLRQP